MLFGMGSAASVPMAPTSSEAIALPAPLMAVGMGRDVPVPQAST